MSRRGFTLIEMIVVITILGIIAGFVVPNLAHMKASREVRSFVNSLPNIAAQARDTALTQGVTTKLTYDDAQRRITLSIEKANEDDTEVTSIDVPSEIQVTSFEDSGETRTAGDWTLRFYSDGRSDGGGVETNDAGLVRSLVVDRDGVAKLQAGPMPQQGDSKWPAGDYEHRA